MKRKQLRLLIETLDQLAGQSCRMEAAQALTNRLLADRLERFDATLRKHIDRQTSEQLDRGQTASALHGLIKRLDAIERLLAPAPRKTPAK